jgi:hypothetical protein
MDGRTVVDLVDAGRIGDRRCSDEEAFQKEIIVSSNFQFNFHPSIC